MKRSHRWMMFTIVTMMIVATQLATQMTAEATSPGSNGVISYFRSGRTGWGSVSLRSIHPNGKPAGVLWPAGDHLGSRYHRAVPTDVEWSPDGSVVAFVATGSILGYDRLLVGDPATGERSVILRIGRLDDHAFIASIAFAPSGDTLLFCAVDLGGKNSAHLFTIGTDGRHIGRVSDRPSCLGDWSSTNKIVAVTGAGLRRIVVMDPDGTNQHPIVSSDRTLERSDPSWSPDGATIVYARPAGTQGRGDLVAVAADGSSRVRLTHTPRLDEGHPVFAPDGTAIALTKGVSPDDRADLYTMDADGSNIQRLTHTPRYVEWTRSWQAVA
jgi:Tol biopolymer transport system component